MPTQRHEKRVEEHASAQEREREKERERECMHAGERVPIFILKSSLPYMSIATSAFF